MRRPRGSAAFLALWLLAACGDAPLDPDPGEETDSGPVLTEGTDLYTYSVVASYPHDSEAFTQGLVLDDGELFEGTGLYGASSLRRVDLATGSLLRRHDLSPDLFGEGVAAVGDRILQLTWQAGRGFVYERETFAVEREFTYTTEGWGLTWDGELLVMSDGTSRLYFLDPDGFAVEGSVNVTWQGEPVQRLNELEYIEGHVFANVWLTDRIAVIDPGSGAVVSWVDLEGLLPPEDREGADVLNGIAVDVETGHLLVTGKLWPTLFEIELVPLEGPAPTPPVISKRAAPPRSP